MPNNPAKSRIWLVHVYVKDITDIYMIYYRHIHGIYITYTMYMYIP